ncbi:DUF3331 domain-containing protein [Burkholderia pyrrocinia]|uniref:DUF3331 domain-containing protein n=1 Tax=Burkholderia pyrrocinia TaxID=60550 RepID=UPI00130DEBC4
MLFSVSQCEHRVLAARVQSPERGSSAGAVPTIVLLEQLDATTISLSWHDATECNYEEQKWIVGKAARGGRCALSGRPINRGDSVFRPLSRRAARPRNAHSMIRADVIAIHAV